MQRGPLREVALLCLTIGGGILAVCGVKDQFSAIWPLPGWVFRSFLVIGLLLLAVAGVIGSTLIGPLLLRRRTFVTYEAVLAGRGDLETLHIFCEKYVGPHFATLESWIKRHERNPATFFMVKQLCKSPFKLRETLVGVFTVIPVSKEAKQLLEQDELSAIKFTPQHITPPKQAASGLYISSVVGSGFRSKGFVLSLLRNRLRIEHERGNHLLYTRPMTKDGLRLAKAFGFSPVNSAIKDQPNHIYKKDLTSSFDV